MVEGPVLFLVIGLALAFIILGTAVLKLHPFLTLLLAALGVGIAVNMPAKQVVETISSGFGSLMGYIGLVVVLGSIIGVVLEKSGAAHRIADLVLRALGPQRPALAMSLIGLVVGIPVFCDSGFIILSGINRALAARSRVSKGALTISLASGLYTSHTLIPPTPGPIAAAGNLGAANYLGTVILVGLAISVPVGLVAYAYANWIGRSATANFTEEPLPAVPAADQPVGSPSLLTALAPILVPLALISLASVVPFLALPAPWAAAINFLGLPLVALLIGVFLCAFLLPKWESTYVSGWVGEGIQQAGPILILTGAGGAFGAVLKATPVSELVSQWITAGQQTGGYILVISFLIAAILKTSQGSTTSALVITSSMLAPLMSTIGFETPLELSLLVMAIGSGAMVVSHANDSFFWVVTQFSGISVKEAYRGFTIVTLLQGLTGLLVTVALYYLLC
jgi:gluconate:H+ symporter, GntP family